MSTEVQLHGVISPCFWLFFCTCGDKAVDLEIGNFNWKHIYTRQFCSPLNIEGYKRKQLVINFVCCGTYCDIFWDMCIRSENRLCVKNVKIKPSPLFLLTYTGSCYIRFISTVNGKAKGKKLRHNIPGSFFCPTSL